VTLQVILADEHAMVRQGVQAVFEREGIRVVGEVGDGRAAVELAHTLRPDVAVLDLALPLLNGLDAARAIRRVSPDTKPVLLTVHAADSNVLDALHAGVRGYVLKTQAMEDLLRAVVEVSRGAIYLSPGVSRAVVEAYLKSGRGATRGVPQRLTPRERHVLQLVAEEKTTKQIAALLGVSVKTAESHRMRVMRKLNIHSTAGLVRYAIREGVVAP
jgi:two-component system response regulator NreC